MRIMTLHNGTLGFDVMDQVMAEVHPFGWHANIQLDGRSCEVRARSSASRQLRHRPPASFSSR